MQGSVVPIGRGRRQVRAEGPWLDRGQLAAELGVSQSTVKRWRKQVRAGQPFPVHDWDGTVRYVSAEVVAWLEGRVSR